MPPHSPPGEGQPGGVVRAGGPWLWRMEMGGKRASTRPARFKPLKQNVAGPPFLPSHFSSRSIPDGVGRETCELVTNVINIGTTELLTEISSSMMDMRNILCVCLSLCPIHLTLTVTFLPWGSPAEQGHPSPAPEPHCAEVGAQTQPAPVSCVGFTLSLTSTRFWGPPAARSLRIPPAAHSSPRGALSP